MQKPLDLINCPDGLEYLFNLNGLVVKQEISSFSDERRYVVKNFLGESIYYTTESMLLQIFKCTLLIRIF